MKILLVNNHTQHLEYLNKSLAGHQVESVLYNPGVEFNYADKDMVILSGGGGEGLEIEDRHHTGKLWYHDEMDLVQRCDKPIFGICMGFEVIARSFGSPVKQLKTGLVEGFIDFETTKKGREHLSRRGLKQFEAHEWHVDSVSPREFDILAESHTGIEIIKHKRRPIFATQFHPEKGGTLKLQHMLAAY